MKLYSKLKYFAIPVSAVFMSLVLLVSPVNAGWANWTQSINGVTYQARMNSPTTAVVNNISGTVESSKPVAEFSFGVDFYMQSNYTTPLYHRGYFTFLVSIPYSLPTGVSLGTAVDFTVSSDTSQNQYTVVPYVAFYSSSVMFPVHVYLDNFYTIGNSRNVTFAEVNLNISGSVSLPIDYVNSAELITFGASTISSEGYQIDTSVLPGTTSGLAGVISQSVLFGLQQYNSNDYLVSMRDLLSSIYSNDVSLYQQILSQLIADTQNDNRLYGLFELLMRDLFTYTYSNRLYDMAEMTYFIMSSNNGIQSDLSRWVNELWPNYINQGQATAAAAQSSADAANNAMESAGIALEVPTRDISSDLAGASNYLTPEVASSQGDLFFWLRGNHILVVVLTLSVTFGLMGFILYGKA